MATNSPNLRSQILNLFQTRPSLKLHTIVASVNTNRKAVNQELYKLRRENIVHKIQETPPIWSLNAGGAVFHTGPGKSTSGFPHRRGRGRGRGKGKVPNKVCSRSLGKGQKRKDSRAKLSKDTIRKIYQYLSKNQNPVQTKDIVKCLGFRNASAINPSLYFMQSKNIIYKEQDSPPTWSLKTLTYKPEFLEDTLSGMPQSFLEGSEFVDSPASNVSDSGSIDQISVLCMSNISLSGDDETSNVSHNPTLQSDHVFSGHPIDSSHFMDSLARQSSSHYVEVEEESEDPLSEISTSLNISCDVADIDTDTDYNDIADAILPCMTPNSLPVIDCQDLETIYESGGESAKRNISSPYDTRNIEMFDKYFKKSAVAENDNSRDGPNSSNISDQSADQYSLKVRQVSQDSELSESDRVMQSLASCPFCSAVLFVLVDKLGLRKERIESILHDLKNYKYVDFVEPLWTLTPAGEKYIKSKTGISSIVKIPNKPLVRDILFKGPPPSPHALLQSKGHSISGPDSLPNKPSIEPVLSSVHQAQPLMTKSTQPTSSSPMTQLMKAFKKETPLSTYSDHAPSKVNQTNFSSNSSFSSLNSVRMTSVTPNSVSSSSFRLPPPPLELIRKQMKQTDISHQLAGPQSLPFLPTPQMKERSSKFSSLPISVNLMPSVSPQSCRTLSGPDVGVGLSDDFFKALNKNPVSALMEYAQSRHTVARIEVLSQTGASHRPVFIMAAFVGDRQFPSITCSNKKDGRMEAADIALRKLIAEGQYQTEQSTAVTTKPSVSLSKMTHFDRIAALTHQGFNKLIASIAENFAGRKVIAGMVMTRSPDDMGILISLGSGNRCITGPQLSLEGNTVNDSHAEIITRRGFLRFLYKHLLQYDPSKPSQMFEMGPTGKLRIRDGIKFHLYISTAPCGDGALFSPRDTASNNAPLQNLNNREHNPTITSNVQGLLRTKVEGGEGTIPIEPNFAGQTWDGILRGERLRTMSCTDKICRWNVVGMQGALLSHFLEPIYLDSLTLGFLYDHGHLARAVCCRLAQGETKIDDHLPVDFKLNHPWLGRVTACEPTRETQKTKSLSINWALGDERPEVTDGSLGLCYTGIEKGFFSRCSKRNLYDNFKKVCERFGKQELLAANNYHEAKGMAKDFVKAKETMLMKFKENKCGIWVSKPIEEEMFS
ncbi:hypothetical protein CHS0354_010347 [Potamilus streckersoni]|uniref:Double-stranded RNA-specific adenosine deaminase n=1 Tax=Potamilus streckersoni TaxID=2493646 RepID=A0AAE0TDN7_9BIVA|nr:hypothetical protein CHS0354_010347 [Potamilus streckersoni]